MKRSTQEKVSGKRCQEPFRAALEPNRAGVSLLGDFPFEADRSSLGIVYGLTAATRRVATHGPQPYQDRTPSDRDSVIFSPQAWSSPA